MADDKEEDTRIKNEEFELKFRLKFSRWTNRDAV